MATQKETIIRQSDSNVRTCGSILTDLDSKKAREDPKEVQRLNVKVKAVNASNIAIQRKISAERVYRAVRAK